MRDLYASKNNLRENCFLNFSFAATSFFITKQKKRGRKEEEKQVAIDVLRLAKVPFFGNA